MLAKGYNTLLQASVKFDLPRILLLVFAGVFNPKWLGLPLNKANRTIIEQNHQLQKFTAQVVADKIEKIRLELEEEEQGNGGGGGGSSSNNGLLEEKKEVEDLVHVIIRTNLQMEKKELEKFGKTNTMSAKELQGQIQVLLFAGYETSSVTTVSREDGLLNLLLR